MNVQVEVDVTVGAVGFGFEDPLPLVKAMVNPAIDPCVQATVTDAFPVTPVVLTDRGMASPDVTCTVEETNSVITGEATTVTVTLAGWPPLPVDTETLVVGFVTVSV